MDENQREWYENLPCLDCMSEQGQMLRHLWGQGGLDMDFATQCLPTGRRLPLLCCRVSHQAILTAADPPPRRAGN